MPKKSCGYRSAANFTVRAFFPSGAYPTSSPSAGRNTQMTPGSARSFGTGAAADSFPHLPPNPPTVSTATATATAASFSLVRSVICIPPSTS